MTQPPSSQPPQGGFGAPQDKPQGPPAQPPGPPPQMPAAPPTAPAQPPQPPSASPQPGYGYPGTPPPGPGYGYPQTPPAPGYGYPTVPSGPGAQDNPYAQTQQGGYGYPGQPQYPGAPVAPRGGGGKSPFKGKPADDRGSGGRGPAGHRRRTCTWRRAGAATTRSPSPTRATARPPAASPTVDQGDGKGDGRTGSDDINSGAKAGDARAWLHENETPTAAERRRPSTAPGSWATPSSRPCTRRSSGTRWPTASRSGRWR